MGITIRDISRVTGKSYQTVSYALNDNPHISLQTRRMIHEAAERLGYTRSRMARQLRTGKTGIIGICLPSPQGYFYAELASGLHQAIVARGYSPIFSFWSLSSEEASATSSVLSWNPEGIITIAPGHIPVQNRTPVVSYFNCDPRFDCVRFNINAAYDQLTTYLHRLGHRSIGWLGIENDLTRKTLRHIAEEKGLTFQEFCTTETACLKEKKNTLDSIITRHFSKRPFPTAIVASSDFLAMTLISQMAMHGIRCPQDVSVIGFDDLLISASFNPPLTTFDRHVQTDLSTALVETILTRMKNPELPQQIVELVPEFIERNSTAASPQTEKNNCRTHA